MIANAQEARKRAALNKLYNFDGQIMSMAEFFNLNPPIRKIATTRNHETKRRELEYKPLSAPKTEYSIYYKDGDNERGIGVPKMVFDHYDIERIDVKAY